MALEDLQSQYGPTNKKGQIGTGKNVDTLAFDGEGNKVLEANFNNNVMKWPISVSPFDVAIIPSLQKNDKSNYLKAEKIYNFLIENGIDVIFDNTEEHLSAKFKKFDLIGVPFQIILGSKSTNNKLEFKEVNGRTENLSLKEIKDKLLINKRNSN